MIGIKLNKQRMLNQEFKFRKRVIKNAICYLEVFLKEMLKKETCFYLQLYGTFSKTLVDLLLLLLWLPPLCSVRPDVVDGTSHSLNTMGKKS